MQPDESPFPMPTMACRRCGRTVRPEDEHRFCSRSDVVGLVLFLLAMVAVGAWLVLIVRGAC